ncbi:MAG: glycosyltransferase [Candidatus Bathyarchaeia archaeon]
MYCLAVGWPYPHRGGGGKRTFEVLKHISEFEITPILYVPYSDLISTALFEEIWKLESFVQVLKRLERFNVIVPSDLYEDFERIKPNVQHYLDCLQKKSVYATLSNLKKHIQSIRGFKDNIFFTKKFLASTVQSDRIIPDKLNFIYSMDEIASCVIAGAFLARSLERKLYIQLQAEPFKRLKDLMIDDWRLRVTLAKQRAFREILRFLPLILNFTFSNPRYSYSYAFKNNLNGLLAVSEAPLVISGLDSWASRRRIKVKVVRPGNAVDEEISRKYVDEEERRRLLHMKRDVAIYYSRLYSPKGLFDIPPIAKKLAMNGYRIIVIGRFERMNEKRSFFRICEEKKIKNIEYLGWLPREKLIEVVSRSKVLIYPSHSDAFSLVVLEALFLGCSVVAYDIPAIRSVYKGLKPVKIVKEYDYKAMAEEAIKILKRDVSKHEEEHLDDNFMNFLKMHSSWRNVAKADIEAIREMMNYPSRTC